MKIFSLRVILVLPLISLCQIGGTETEKGAREKAKEEALAAANRMVLSKYNKPLGPASLAVFNCSQFSQQSVFTPAFVAIDGMDDQISIYGPKHKGYYSLTLLVTIDFQDFKNG